METLELNEPIVQLILKAVDYHKKPTIFGQPLETKQVLRDVILPNTGRIVQVSVAVTNSDESEYIEPKKDNGIRTISYQELTVQQKENLTSISDAQDALIQINERIKKYMEVFSLAKFELIAVDKQKSTAYRMIDEILKLDGGENA